MEGMGPVKSRQPGQLGAGAKSHGVRRGFGR